MEDNKTNTRKLEHIKIVLEKDVEPIPNPLSKYKLPYSAMPEIDMNEIDTSTKIFDKDLSFPFFISSMTGGPQRASVINKNLAIAAEEAKVGLGLGSMRVIIRHPESVSSFQVKKYCPSVPLFANLGLVQLNYGFGVDEVKRIIESIEADGIFLHINHLQEAIQPEGDVNYKDLFHKLEKIIPQVEVPIIVKEVGAGVDFATAKRLFDIGIKWIDVAGLGGTSWSWVEGYRRDDKLGEIFKDVGIPTNISIKECKRIEGLSVIGSGGIRSGVDIAKALMLGADLAASAKPLLEPALTSPEEVVKKLNEFRHELKVAMFSIGAKDISVLKTKELRTDF